MKNHTRLFRLKFAAAAVLLALSAPPPLHAFEIRNQAGEVIGSFDTTISIGGSWRAQGRDPALVGITNGGTSRSTNEDDGNLNYNKDKLFSNPAKVTHELGLRQGNFGIFTRGTYFYDFAYQNQSVDNFSGFGPRGRDRLGTSGELLDLFVYGGFDLGGHKLNLRLGQQVVSWGESTFIPGGINSINPVNVSKLRGPGSEIREALLPTPMIWASQSLTDRVTVEGFALAKFNRTRLDPSGSYFSTTDILSDDGARAFVGFGRRKDQHFPFVVPAPAGTFNALTGQVWIPRITDRDAKDGGEYGLAMRLFLREFNNTELGFFHMNYHSRTPIATGIRGTSTNLAVPGTARYFAEYPEDIRLWGVSFSTAGPAGIALQGEYSYRPNMPLQLSSIELLLAGLGLTNNITGTLAQAAAVPVGTEISGYRRAEMHQFQMTATKVFANMFKAESFTLLGEVGYTYLNLPTNLLFNAPGVQLPAPGSFDAANGSFQPGGYMSKNSWGYRLLGSLSYPNAVGPVNLTPRIAFSHDVRGASPTFNQGTKAITFGLGANFKQNWQADLSYTTYWGGRTYSGTDSGAAAAAYTAIAGQSPAWASSANPLKDRDFINLSVSYSF